MKIAIPLAGGKLTMHFGHCEKFALIETNPDDRIIGKEELTPPPHEPGVLPKWLGEMGVNLIIAGGMGMRAQEIFSEYNVKVITGAQPDLPENIVAAYFAGTLAVGANACDH